MFRLILLAALILPAASHARPHPSKGARAKPVARKAPAARRSPARRASAPARARRASKARVDARVVVKPTGKAMRAPSRMGRGPARHRGHRRDMRRRSRRGGYYYGSGRYYYGGRYHSRPRYRPVVVIVHHDRVYDGIRRAERRMRHLEERADRAGDSYVRREVARDAADMDRDLDRLDRDADRIRSWYHWERTVDRVDALRGRLRAVNATLAAAPPRLTHRPVGSSQPHHGTAMPSARFERIEHELEAAPFRDDKLRIVRRIVRDGWFTSAQAKAVASSMHFGDDKVTALTLMHPRVVDPDNFGIVYGELAHRSDREALEAAIYAGY